MKLYFAPLEGITTYTYRNVHNEMFGLCDAHFAPFITPTDNERLTIKNLRGIMPETNAVNLRVQCLASSETAFVKFVKRVTELGYEEVNLNLGCPSGTVVSKGRGAGALRDLKRLDQFLRYIYEQASCKISIKTRTGFDSHNEFEGLIKLYNQYPVTELIVHPRARADYYQGAPRMESFDLAYSLCKTKLCYNGDIFTIEDYIKIAENYPKLDSVMIGRGAVKNPALFREIKGGKKLVTAELVAFSRELEKQYLPILHLEVNTLRKLKEVWTYAIENYPEEKKIAKAIKKSGRLSELNGVIQCLPELK